jgi:hypothetical protein
MVKIRCQNCGRIVEVEKAWNKSFTCDDCSGNFAELNSKDDTFEEESEDSEEETEFDCENCGETISKDKIVFFDDENIQICKKCIDEAYPREVKTEIKEVVKFIEDKTSYNKFNPEAKSKFD